MTKYQPRPAVLHTSPAVQQDKPNRPTRAEIIATIAVAYGSDCDEYDKEEAAMAMGLTPNVDFSRGGVTKVEAIPDAVPHSAGK